MLRVIATSLTYIEDQLESNGLPQFRNSYSSGENQVALTMRVLVLERSADENPAVARLLETVGFWQIVSWLVAVTYSPSQKVPRVARNLLHNCIVTT